MTKILHISKFFYPYFGGIEDMALTIVDELKPNFEQMVFCFNHEKGTQEDLFNTIPIYRVGTTFTVSSQPLSVSYIKCLSRIVNKFSPDYIHVHLPNPLAALALLIIRPSNSKIILHWHADILNKGVLYKMIKPIEKRIVEAAYKIVCTSTNYAQSSPAINQYQDKITILQNTIDDKKLDVEGHELYKIDEVRRNYNNRKIVFFVGRHVPYKGIEYLIKSEEYITEDCVIVIAGEGELTESLKRLCGANSRIVFTGKLSNDELKYHLYASSVFAFPSVNRSEAFGLALAEALYCGVPAVSFNIEGSGSLWVNKDRHSGYIVENKNEKAFGKAISKILASDELQMQLSTNAQRWVRENFVKSCIGSSLNLLYK